MCGVCMCAVCVCVCVCVRGVCAVCVRYVCVYVRFKASYRVRRRGFCSVVIVMLLGLGEWVEYVVIVIGIG